MMRRFTVAVGAGIMVAVPLAAGLTGSAAAQDDEPVTLTIGLQQDLDSPNVTAGFLVSAFELWNLQYATLTDKAADDFETIPGLAESWEASPDGLTYTYTLRDGLQWSDGEPLTAEDIAYTINRSRDEEWINHSATTVNLEATGARRAHGRGSRPRCPTRSFRRWTCTSSRSTSTSRYRPRT